MSEPEPQSAHIVFQVPAELEAGVYANFLAVWHTPHEFTLDFAATLPPQPPGDPDESPTGLEVPARVVARVKLPPSVLFDVLRAINENMGRYEATYGPIPRPQEDSPAQPE